MKIITYNIENYEGDWRERLQLIADLLIGSGADIICLNEVRGMYDGSPNQGEYLQGLLNRTGDWNLLANMAAAYTSASPPQWEGLAILSREDLLMQQTGTVALTICASEPLNRRIVQYAGFDLDGSGELFYVFNNHLTTDTSDCYATQLNELIDYASQFNGPAVLVGDLNQPDQADLCGDTPCVPDTLQPLIDAGWSDLWMQQYAGITGEQGYTWKVGEGDTPSKRIDYIWARGTAVNTFVNIETLGASAVNGQYLSDHMAVMATFAMN